MAAAYLEADLGALHRLAELVELQSRGELQVAGLAAMTALEDRFGLTPRARQVLLWQVLAAGADQPGPAAGDPPQLSEGKPPASSVRRLRAVDPKAASS